jgi:phytoene synthase
MTTLDESYEQCRALARRHGTTYFVATYALPRIKRHHVWALYAFCRRADDIVDDLGDAPVEDRAIALKAFGEQLFVDLARGDSSDPILKAVVHTIRAFGHDPELFHRFLTSMTMDLSTSRYETWDDLLVYMDGSAAVIGEMMLPILEPTDAGAVDPARSLGLAFQLTNFLRDVEEDLRRGRVYIPQSDLRAFGADPSRRCVDSAWVALMRFEIERCRQLYVEADAGIEMLPPSSARCVRTARVLYSRILDRVERQQYDVFSSRVRVPTWQKVATACRVAVQPATA